MKNSAFDHANEQREKKEKKKKRNKSVFSPTSPQHCANNTASSSEAGSKAGSIVSC